MSFLRKAQNRAGAEPHLESSHDPHAYEVSKLPSGKLVSRKASASTVLLQNPRDVEIVTATSTANTFASSGTSLDIRVPAGSAHIVHGTVLKLVVTNGTGAATTLVPAPLLIDNIEIWFNNGNTLAQRISGHSIWLDNNMLSKEQWSGFASVENTTTAWGAPAAIANGASATYHIPFNSVFSTSELFLGGLAGDVIFRVYFFGGAAKICEAGAVPTLTSFSLLLETTEVPQSKFDKMKAMWQRGVYDHPFLNQNVQSVSQTFNAATQYTQVLSGVTGLVSHFWITLRASILAGGMRTYTSTIDSLNLLDETSNNITGLASISAAYNRYVKAPQLFPGDLTVQLPVLHYSHSLHPVMAQQSGSNYGSYAYDGKEQLQITTSAAHANGAYTLEAIAYVYSLLRVNGGTVEIYRS